MLDVIIMVAVAVISFMCGYYQHKQQLKDYQQNLKTEIKQETETYIKSLKQEITDLKSQPQAPEALDKPHAEKKPLPLTNDKINIHEYTINNKAQGMEILTQKGLYIYKENYGYYFNNSNNRSQYYFENYIDDNIAFIFCVSHPDKNFCTFQNINYYKNNHENIKNLYIFHKSSQWLQKIQKREETTWNKQQEEVKIYEYIIKNRQEGFDKLRVLGILGVSGESDYNSANSNLLDYELINKPSNLEFIYIKARNNPFGRTYLTGYDLEYYKQEKATIEAIYIFLNSNV